MDIFKIPTDETEEPRGLLDSRPQASLKDPWMRIENLADTMTLIHG